MSNPHHPRHHTHHRRHHTHLHPSTLPHFIQLAPAVMQDLIAFFGLSPIQAAAILGNLGVESNNFTAYHEIGQAENKGGFGWGQWTWAPRRKAFFDWADSHQLPRQSAEASFTFLVHELETTYSKSVRNLKKQTDLSAATYQFMHDYENPGVPNLAARQSRAAIALKAYNQSAFAPQTSARI